VKTLKVRFENLHRMRVPDWIVTLMGVRRGGKPGIAPPPGN